MRAVFNAEKIDMFTMNKILGQWVWFPSFVKLLNLTLY